MYRSSSTTRVSDEYFSHTMTSSPVLLPPSASSILQNNNNNNSHGYVDQQQVLPTYSPQSHVARKDKGRIRSAENVIHLIPLILVLCAIILWFFSSPVDVVSKGDSLVARVASSITNGDDHTRGERGIGSSLSEVIREDRFGSRDESEDSANDRSKG